jgi:hypothetical protein
MVFPNLREQSYVTDLTYEQAKQAAEKPSVACVVLAGSPDGEEDDDCMEEISSSFMRKRMMINI